MNIALASEFALRQSVSEAFLQNIQTGHTYYLQEDQADFIRMLDGSLTESGVVDSYDSHSRKIVTDFFAELRSLNAISFGGNRRIFARPVVDPRLEAVHFEPSGICNMRCAHCYQGQLVKNGETLPKELVIKLLDDMVELQVGSISVSGGEPLMMPNLAHLLSEIERRGMYLSAVFTNGLLASESFVDILGKLRYKAPLYLSLDSLPGYGFEFRGFSRERAMPVLKRIVRNIKLLVRAGFRVTVNTVVNTENIGILNEMYDLMAELGVFNWRLGFPKMTPNFKEHRNLGADWTAIAEKCFAILQRHIENHQPFSLQVEYMYRDLLFEQGLPNLALDDYVCDYEGRRREVNIKPNGDVVSCAYCNELPIGNVHKQSLKEIWYSEGMQQTKSIRISDVNECRGCELISLCGTGCRANAFFLHGDFLNSRDDYACHAVRFFREKVQPFLSQHGIA